MLIANDRISLRRAAKILEPIIGSFEKARQLVVTGIYWQDISVTTSDETPKHDNAMYSKKHKVFGFWFGWSSHTITPLFVGEPIESLPLEWRKFLFDGGVLINRDDVEQMRSSLMAIGDNHWLSTNLEMPETNWSFLQALAWVASQNNSLVRVVGYLERDGTNFPSKLMGSINPIGWLMQSIVDQHCTCRALPTQTTEKW